MKLAMVTQDGLSTVNFCAPFVRHLREEGIDDVEVITLSTSDLYAAEIGDLGTRHVEIEVSRYVDPIGDVRYAARLYRILKTEAFDAVISFGTKPNAYAPLAARAAGVPAVIMAVRGLGRVFSAEARGRVRVARRFLEGLYWISARASDKVWFTNEGDRTQFVESGLAPMSKTFMTRNGVNVDVFFPDGVPSVEVGRLKDRLGIAVDDFTVVMVARMVWAKGVREFVDAARIVAEGDPRVRFLLVGPLEERTPDAVPRSFLEQAVRQRLVQWLGFRKDVREIYAACDLAVLPSYYREGGYPRALLEPMAMGKPVIAADTPDCRGPVEHGVNGYLVPPRDAEALAQRILEIGQDPVLSRRLGVEGLRRIRTVFDDRIFARKVLQELGSTDILCSSKNDSQAMWLP